MSSHKQWIPLVTILAILGFASLVFVLSLSDPQADSGPDTDLAKVEDNEPAGGQAREGWSAPPPQLHRVKQDPRDLPTRNGGDSESGYLNRVHGAVISARDEDRLANALVQIKIKPTPFAFAAVLGQPNQAPTTIVAQTKTDPLGHFQFFNIAPGKPYELVVSHPDYAQASLAIPNVPREGSSAEYIIPLEEGFSIAGQVFDKRDGHPISGAQLIVRRSNPMAVFLAMNSSQVEEGDRTVATDEGGFFEIRNAPLGAVDVLVQAEGYAEIRESMLLDATSTPSKRIEKTFRLIPGSTIAGRVETTEGTPLPNARVIAMRSSQHQTSSVSALADENGAFELKGLQEGEEYFLRSMLVGYLGEGQNRHETGEKEVVLKMSPTGKVIGRAINQQTNRPLTRFSAAIIQYRKNQILAPRGGPAVVDRQGAGLGTIDPTSSPNPRKNLATLGGINSQPVIYSELRGSRQSLQSRDGTFELSGISAAGDFVVLIEASGLAPQVSQSFHCNKGMSVDVGDILVGRGGAIEGVVTDAQGAAVANARVHINCGGTDPSQNPLLGLLGPIGPQPLQRKSATTDEQGRYRLDLLIPIAGVNIVAQAAGYTDGFSPQLEVRANETTTVAPIALNRGGTVLGVVLQDGVTPMPGKKVSLRPATNTTGRFFNREIVTGKSGKFRFEGVPAGKYKIHATGANLASGGNPFGIILDIKKTEQTIDVYEGEETEVTISTSTSTPMAPMRQVFPRNPTGPRNQAKLPKKPFPIKKPIKPNRAGADDNSDLRGGGDAGREDGG